MTAKQFRRYLDRDQSCWHCGEVEAVAPHHRVNRGMGGSKAREKPSNTIVMCSSFNQLMESETGAMLAGMQFGWKLPAYAAPESEPVYNMNDGRWYVLDNDYGKEEVSEYRSDGRSASSL